MTGETTKNSVAARLTQLRSEYAKGENMLAHLEQEAVKMREQLLRLSGAIQVLEEMEGGEDSEKS
ncbi:MAG: hypothetical protein AAF557_22595 [Pseudomonadota bacterium]